MELHDIMEKSVDQLRVINAEGSLAEYFELVSILIEKLHVDYQE